MRCFVNGKVLTGHFLFDVFTQTKFPSPPGAGQSSDCQNNGVPVITQLPLRKRSCKVCDGAYATQNQHLPHWVNRGKLGSNISAHDRINRSINHGDDKHA